MIVMQEKIRLAVKRIGAPWNRILNQRGMAKRFIGRGFFALSTPACG
jgi:hypothetical protein